MRLTALLLMAAKAVAPKDGRYGTNKPGTFEFMKQNIPGMRRRKVFVEPLEPEDWTVFRGDTVRNPLSGNFTII